MQEPGGIVDRDTGLIRFGARDYDPSIGRWIEKEPLGFEAANNFYQYASGDPVNWVDVTGLAPCPTGPHGTVDYVFFGAAIQFIPGVPIVVNPQITVDRYGQAYFGIGAGYASAPSLSVGGGRLNPLSPCKPSAAALAAFLAGNSINYSLGLNSNSSAGFSVGGSTTLSPGYPTALEGAFTVSEPGLSGSATWQHTWRIK